MRLGRRAGRGGGNAAAEAETPPADALAGLESHVEELARLAERDAVALDRLLGPLTHFIFSASRLAQNLKSAGAGNEHRGVHALTLSLLHLAREVERRVASFEPAAGDPASLRGNWDPLMVRPMLDEQSRADREVFGRALLIHPWETYRRLALEILEPPDFWNAIAHERLPLDWLLELWRHLEQQVGDDYLKIFFVCVKDRLARPAEGEGVVAAVELVKELFRVDCFHETLYFKMLTELEGHVRAEARRHGLLADFDSEYVSRIQAFRARPARPDEPVKAWGKVPLPIQRLLARRGHFQRHFSCHPIDPIALECLPHILFGEDVAGFLKLAGLNARLLGELAKEERLYQNENNKYLLVANPKTPPFIVAKHIGYLRGDSLNKLVCSHECNRFAHDYATRLLEKRGRFRAGPDQGI